MGHVQLVPVLTARAMSLPCAPSKLAWSAAQARACPAHLLAPATANAIARSVTKAAAVVVAVVEPHKADRISIAVAQAAVVSARPRSKSKPSSWQRVIM